MHASEASASVMNQTQYSKASAAESATDMHAWRTWTVVAWGEEKPSRYYRSVQNGEATVVCSMESILYKGRGFCYTWVLLKTSEGLLSLWLSSSLLLSASDLISTQLLLTASKTVWRSEENVRWTFSKTACLQVLWLHCTTVLDLWWMFHELDDGTRCSYPLRLRFTISGRLYGSVSAHRALRLTVDARAGQQTRMIETSAGRHSEASLQWSVRQLHGSRCRALCWHCMGMESRTPWLGTRSAIVKLGGRYDASPVHWVSETAC